MKREEMARLLESIDECLELETNEDGYIKTIRFMAGDNGLKTLELYPATNDKIGVAITD